MNTTLQQPTRLIAGCMTGTSIDSLDAALVRIHGRGLTMRAEVVRTLTRPLNELGPPLRRLAEQQPMTAGQIAALSRDFSLLHLAALKELIAGDPADFASIHGQTVFHAPPVSWQLLTPAVIAHGLGVPVVSDLRAADLARGGQGAPITPIADWVLFHERAEGSLAVVNLGGFCNATVMMPATDAPVRHQANGHAPAIEHSHAPLDGVFGLDICACNQLLDAIARELFGTPFDARGARALEGTADEDALDDLEPLLEAQAASGRSLGTGDEAPAWIERWRHRLRPEDLAATACSGIAIQIGVAIRGIETMLVAGGGVNNLALIAALVGCCEQVPAPTDAYGVPGAYREAAAMAVLGALCQDRVPITLPQVTGVRAPAPIAGTWVLP